MATSAHFVYRFKIQHTEPLHDPKLFLDMFKLVRAIDLEVPFGCGSI